MNSSEKKTVLQMKENEILRYTKEVYDWAYVNPTYVKKLDCNLVVKILLFFNDKRMMRAYLSSIKSGMKVWQVAHVYGDLVYKVAQKVGENGAFYLTDATPIQVEHGKNKLKNQANASVWHADAANFIAPETPDLICSFFLLHEVPEDKKHDIVNNMLSQLSDDGEVLFVDYHRPAIWQPVGWLLLLVNRYLEPFAKSLWDKEISHYAQNPEAYIWDKRTIFGNVYQILRVKRKR